MSPSNNESISVSCSGGSEDSSGSSRSIVPGAKFSNTTSALLANLRKSAFPSGTDRSMLSPSFPRFTLIKYELSSPRNGPLALDLSPIPGCSILIT